MSTENRSRSAHEQPRRPEGRPSHENKNVFPAEGIALGPGEYNLTIRSDGTAHLRPDVPPVTEKVTIFTAPDKILPPEDKIMYPAVRALDEPGQYMVRTATGKERLYAPIGVDRDILEFAFENPDRLIDRYEFGDNHHGREFNGVASRINRVTGNATMTVHYYNDTPGGTVRGVEYHSQIAVDKPKPAKTPEDIEPKPRGAVEPLGDPELGVVVYSTRTTGKPEAYILPQRQQRDAFKILYENADHVVPVTDLDEVTESLPRRHIGALAKSLGNRVGVEVITEVVDDSGAPVGYRYNSGIEGGAETKQPVEKAEKATPAVDADAILEQMASRRPGPERDIKERIAWTAAMNAIQTMKNMDMFKDPRRKYYDRATSKVDQGVETIYKAIEAGEVDDGASIRVEDLEPLFGIDVSTPTQNAIIRNLASLGILSEPWHREGRRVNAKYVYRPDEA